jgi:tetratricopeptide (TPR) repeat protein
MHPGQDSDHPENQEMKRRNGMQARGLFAAGLTATIFLAGACSQLHRANRDGQTAAQLFPRMGDHTWLVTTDSPRAQRYFDQGLTWAYAFNHDEAIRTFTEAARLDPECAMAWWGVALCHGPHINFPMMPPERSQAAWAALANAQACKHLASPKEQALIDALAARYADPAPEDRTPLDQAYADAMRKVWQRYPDDSNIATLYGEALMDLHPWDLWTVQRQPRPGAKEVLTVLEAALRLDPDHPGANHLYIHAVEPSAHPEKANAAADQLRDLVPASGHLVHMPSHIDVLTGRWDEAVIQNQKAMKTDRWYRKRSPRQGFYRVYMFHNSHMLAFAGMMSGRYELALAAARDVIESVPEDYKRENAALVDPYMGAVYDVLKRFGKWDAILAEPAPPEYLPITTAMWRYSRGLAYAAKGEVPHARAEQAAFRAAKAAVPADALMAINPAHDILTIAEHMLAGEIALALEDYDAAADALRQGIAVEDRLRYMEPPEWIQPVRHTLGAVQMKAQRFAEAEAAYRADLKRWPANGWSLYGLTRSLRAQGKDQEADAVEAEFRKTWQHADTPIASSCLCIPKT